MECKASNSAISIQDLPLLSLTNETEKVSDLFRLDIFPCSLKDIFLQGTIVPLNSSATGVTNEYHNVTQDATSPLLNECCGPLLPLNLTTAQFRVLPERKAPLNRSHGLI